MIVCICNGLNCEAFRKALERKEVTELVCDPSVKEGKKIRHLFVQVGKDTCTETRKPNFKCRSCRPQIAVMIRDHKEKNSPQ